jgi:hypothetical protein
MKLCISARASAWSGIKPMFVNLEHDADTVAASRRRRRLVRLAVALLLAFAGAQHALAWGGKVRLARKYRLGQEMVYETEIRTTATVQSNPPTLKVFLPPVPSALTSRHRNTVRIGKIHPDGSADIENRFDEFDVQSELPESIPEEVRNDAREAAEEFTRRLKGQTLTARYDRVGRLLDFAGAEELLGELDAPLRDSLREVLKLFLDQMGGNALYPDHRVKPGDEWKQKLSEPASESYPYVMEGESTLRYAGKTRYRGVKAAIIDFRFTNALKPETLKLRDEGPLAELESQGMGIEMQIEGRGEGRILVALDDGRVLQNHSTIQQTLSALLKGSPGVPLPTAESASLQVDSETRLEMDGSGK